MDALQAAVAGDLYRTVDCYEAILKQAPTDVFAIAICQSELFWLGEMKRSVALTRSLAADWNESIFGYSDYLSCHAFDLEETGDYRGAETAGRHSVDLDPNNAWGAHAIAHVLYMQGRFDEGVDWISACRVIGKR